MQTRTLGRTGYEVSLLGLGGHTYRVGETADCYCTADDRALLVERLVSAGVNYFDTTWLNEVELLADSFRRAGIRSDQLNVSIQYVDGMSDPKWPEKLRGEIDSRLRILGWSSAPLFIMGVGSSPSAKEMEAACVAMNELRQEGLIHNVGVSCHELTLLNDLADVIERTDMIDYMMVRYNWKCQQAADRLFPIAASRNVGVVLMKAFCWDCGPGHWDRRISMFEPVDDPGRRSGQPNAAQRSLMWCAQNSPCSTMVPSINALWEAEQLIKVVQLADAHSPVDTSDFGVFGSRLDDRGYLSALCVNSESLDIRDRARQLLDRLQVS